jgi:hypothetical protein
MPKPPILVNRVDPMYLATFDHFSDLIRRYSVPIVVLDLVKQQERRPRESIVGREFRQAVEEINLSMPQSLQLQYYALDHTRASKLKGLTTGSARVSATKEPETSRGVLISFYFSTRPQL